MIQRCYDPNNISYKWYGGKGIGVAPEWMNFETFLADMGDKPTPKHTIDRIDANKNYEPTNCRWATQKEQRRNRRDNKLTLEKARIIRQRKGEGCAIVQLAREFGVSIQLVSNICRGRTWVEE